MANLAVVIGGVPKFGDRCGNLLDLARRVMKGETAASAGE